MMRADSTGGRGSRPAVWVGKVLLLAWLAAMPVMAASAAAPAPAAPSRAHWLRVERRIQRAYFQQNEAALQALGATLAGGAEAPAGGRGGQWRSYYAALLGYRLALLARSDPARAWPFAQQCVEQLDRTLAIDGGSAEALALQSACLALQSRLDPWRSPFAAPLSLIRIDTALRLAPDDPRVLLLAVLAARDRPRLFGGDGQQTLALLRRAVSAFERQSGRPRGLPGWGAADAFMNLARADLTLGQTVAARNVLERALLVAPDFARARQLMAEIVSG
jgi:hypothetical protein